MIYGLILSAGNQSRFEIEKPKALVNIGSKPLVEYSVQYLTPYCDKIYIVCNENNKHYFDKYYTIVISSGKGSGDAVLSALEELPLIEGDKCFIQWGDSYCNFEVVKCTFMQGIYSNDTVFIPCEIVDKPYVQLEQIGNNIEVRFSKFNETITRGYHDLSLFFGSALYIKKCLETYRNMITVDGQYRHKHGNEMEFLDAFNEVGMKGQVIPVIYHRCFSFNRLSELSDYTCNLNENNI